MNKNTLLYIGLLTIIAVYFAGCNAPYRSTQITFTSQYDTVAGIINIPKGKYVVKDCPLAIFVHGDGALNASAHGYYKAIWQELARKGIATMSWHKKGIENSRGNWLEQSMDDRTQLVSDAMGYARSLKDRNFSSVGLIGFSQAGWVLPKVAAIDEPDFMIIVSGAINWQRQSLYMTRKRMERAGATERQILKELETAETEFRLFDPSASYDQYLNYVNKTCNQEKCNVMSKDRFGFVQKNILSDATEDINQIDCPVMVIFGENDLNIDYAESMTTYDHLLSSKNHTNFRIKAYTEATHALLKSRHFNTQKPGLGFLIKLRLMNKNAFTRGFLQDISEFILTNK